MAAAAGKEGSTENRSWVMDDSPVIWFDKLMGLRRASRCMLIAVTYARVLATARKNKERELYLSVTKNIIWFENKELLRAFSSICGITSYLFPSHP